MSWLLRKLPFYDTAEQFTVGTITIRLKPFQIPVCITLCRQGGTPYDPLAPLVPAVLDTGYNGGFSIRGEQLREWGGCDPRWFPLLRTRTLTRGTVDARAANIWIHRNVPYSVNPSRQDPHRIELDEGMDVFRAPDQPSDKDSRPELPLLGMRALRRNDLFLTIDFRKALVDLTKPRWFFWTWAY